MKNQIFKFILLIAFVLNAGSSFGQTNTEEISPNPKLEIEAIATPAVKKNEKIVISQKKPNGQLLKTKFEDELKSYKNEKKGIEKNFNDLIAQFKSEGVSYSEFQKTWRSFASKALNFPESIPVYARLDNIIDQAPDDNDEQSSIVQNMRNQYYQLIETDRQEIYIQLKDLNELRSQVLQSSLLDKNLNLFGEHSGAFTDVRLEVQLVSYQYKSLIEQKISLLRKNFYGGFWGITEIIKEILIILFVLALPFIFYSLFLKFSESLEIKQKEFFRKGYRESHYRTLATWIQRINPYLPWIFIIILISSCEKLLLQTNIYEFFVMFSPFVKVYAIYRIFRILIELSLTKVLRSIGATNRRELKTRLVSTSKFIGLYFFWLFCILYSVENAVNKGLIYLQVKAFSYWVSFFVLSYAFSKWKNEIADYISHINSHSLFQKLSHLCRGRFNILFCFPAVLLIIGHIVLLWFYGWSKRFEFIKKLSLKILRVRLESSQKSAMSGKVEVPKEYIETFDSYFDYSDEHWVGSNDEFASLVLNEIKEWQLGENDENTLAISGERGAGKTYLMKHLMNTCLQGDIEATYLSIDRKFTKASNIENFIKDKLNIKTSKNEAKLEGEQEESTTELKRVIFIDNIQNLFLGKLNGFDALNSFMQIINSNYKNFYWCCSLTDQSWIYLNCVTDSTHYFRSHLKIPKWDDKSLQKLISSAHQQTNYSHNFDKILFAASQGPMNETFNIEERFFQLLWEQSEGNPQVAKELWLNSIIGVYGQQLRIGLPRDVELQSAKELTQNMLFIFAATFRHESLSIKEASEVTNLPLGLVRQAYKRGLEEGMIENNKVGRYRITIQWTHSLLKLLKRKNYLYGTT